MDETSNVKPDIYTNITYKKHKKFKCKRNFNLSLTFCACLCAKNKAPEQKVEYCFFLKSRTHKMPKNRFLAPKQTVFTLYRSHFGAVLKKRPQ